MSTLRVVYVVCAYICCLHVAADVHGTSQECDDEVCLLQNLVRKPSVSLGESGGSGSDHDQRVDFLQMTSLIDDALRDAAHEALKDLGSYCKWKDLPKYSFQFDGSLALKTSCTNAKIYPEKTLKGNGFIDFAKCKKACADGNIVDRAGSKQHDCFAVASIRKDNDAKTGCWFMTRKSPREFPTFKTESHCFVSATKVGGSYDVDQSGKVTASYMSACTPSLEQLMAMVDGKGRNVGKAQDADAAALSKLKPMLTKAMSSGNANGITYDSAKITFENGDVVFNIVGLGKTDLNSGKLKALEDDVKRYIEGQLSTKGNNVAKVTIT